MDFVRKNPVVSLLVVFILGLVIGLVVLGWGLFPVQWEDATPDALSQQYQQYYVRAVADAYSFDNNTQKVTEALSGWPGVEATCSYAAITTDPAEAQRLSASAAVINGTGCPPVGSTMAQPLPEADGSSRGGWQ